jgi:U3 small nucleolar RNA-associated protein 18
MKDANADEKSKAVIQATEFHSNGQILLTAGLDKSLRLFEVDGRGNPHLQTIFLDDFPIYCAAFSADGKEVIMAGPTQHFYVYDIGSGRVDRVSTLWSV